VAATPISPAPDDASRIANIQRFSLRFAIIAVILAALPFLIGLAGQTNGNVYTGYQTAVDDHMVYAAWMRQAMDGAILFDNRFTTDAQPGLTFHAYFLVLGWIAKVAGITGATTIARLAFTFLFVILLGRLVIRLDLSVFLAKFAIVIACLGGGFGFIQWQTFGRELIDKSGFIAAGTGGWAPIDIWQTEAFVFPSMLINGLFMVSLCLILWIFMSIFEAKENVKAVWGGMGAFALLMNIHSYDVLLIGLVLLAWRIMMFRSGEKIGKWDARVVLMVLGVVPAALWFAYVLKNDAVFQARAATPTFSPTFKQVLFGIFPVAAMAVGGLFEHSPEGRKRWIGGYAVMALFLFLFLLSSGADPGAYFVQVGGFLVLCVATVGALVLVAGPSNERNFLWAWALMGLVALYFPALFQRKLAMGLIIPWGILAAIGFAQVLQRLERSPRNLVAALGLVILCTPSLYWLQREILLIRTNVSTTTRHPVFLSQDANKAIEVISKIPGRKVVLAFSGIPMPTQDVGDFGSPYIPDLNPFLSGLAGAYTYAGHWSETPDYAKRMGESNALFADPRLSDDQRRQFLAGIKADYVVAPVPSTFAEVPLVDLSSLGPVIYAGTQYVVVDVRQIR